ncbi:MAG: hypothetical protein HY520_03915 [Candidatus Aenigmarchaeota archaeon]|nr:hypothetical protein [Candidatus Aenigmarchaeota archaeon]
MTQLARLGGIVGLLAMSCFDRADPQEHGKVQALSQAGYEQMVPGECRVPYGQFLPESEDGGVEVAITFCGKDRRLVIRGENPDGAAVEKEIEVGFYPLSITGDGGKTIYLAGVDHDKNARIDRFSFELPAPALKASNRVYAGAELGCPTGLGYVKIRKAEYLLALDGLDGELWVLPLAGEEPRLLAGGGVIKGMRSMQADYSQKEQQIILTLTAKLGDLHDLAEEEDVVVLVDRNADFSFEDVKRCKWADLIVTE